MKRYSVLVLCVAVLSLVVPSPDRARASADVPRFERAECPIQVPDNPPIDCGYLVVPEDYDEPEGATIRLPVIIVHSRSQNPAPDPLLYTEGGPGYSTLSAVWWLAQSAFVEERDVIILEQRGNRYAEPSLACDLSVWWEEKEGTTPCLDRLVERGIDLAHYTTAAVVADIDALQHALDYERWNLYGISYSTTVMLLAVHVYPEAVRSAILVSVKPPTESTFEHDPEHVVRALNVMLQDCASDPACAAAYPDLADQLIALIRRLNAQPVSFDLTGPLTGERFSMSMDGHQLLSWAIVQAFYGPTYVPHKTTYLPLLIDRVERGKTSLLYPWVDGYWAEMLSDTHWAWGFHLSIQCQEALPAADPEIMAAQAAAYPELEGYVRHQGNISICEAWDLPAAPPLVTAPIESDIPTLILAGAYDPITPPEWSQSVAERLSNSYYYEFPAAGHNVTTDNPCAQGILTAFLHDPTTRPDASCIADVPGPEFVLPQDVIVAPSIYEIHYGEIGYTPIENDLFFGSLLVLLAQIVFLVIAGVVRLVRRRERQTPPDRVAQFAHPLAGLVAVLDAGWALALRSALGTTAATDTLMLRFGLPAEYRALFVVPAVVAVLTVGLSIVAILAWVRRYWSVLGRVFYSLVTLAAIVMTGLAAYWGLLTALF